MKHFYLLATLLVFYFTGMAQVPLKVWDRVIGTPESDVQIQWVGGSGFKMVKTSYGAALIWNTISGGKPVGMVSGMNNDGSTRFSKSVLVHDCSGATCYEDHYNQMNEEKFMDATIRKGNGNLVIAGTMNNGIAPGNPYFTEYELASNGEGVYAHKMYDAWAANGPLLVKHFQGKLGDPYLNQTVLFTTTNSSGGVNAYLYDQERTNSYNLSCFNIGSSISNVGMIMRDASYASSQYGVGSHNLANIMGERNIEYPVKVLSTDDKYFPLSIPGLEYMLAVHSFSNDQCFFQHPARGTCDILLLGIDRELNKTREIRIGGAAGTYTYLTDMSFTKDGNLLVLTSNDNGMETPAGGDFSTACVQRMVKYSLSGTKLWEKCVFLGTYTYSTRIVPQEDGGFLIFSISGASITGKYSPRINIADPSNSMDVTVQKFNTEGERQWDYRFGSEMPEEMGLSAVDLGNDEFAFACGVMNVGNPVSGDRTQSAIGGQRDIWLLKFKNYPAHSIHITSLDKDAYILRQDNTIRINYSIPADYNFGNQFYVQLSDASGNFVTDYIAALVTTVKGGEIIMTIPPTLPPGNQYRVRVVSTEPRDTSLPSAPFAILPVPANPSDSLALVTLYNSTNGPNWTNHSNWKTSNPLKTWYGVTVNDAGRVTELVLYNNNLEGNMPDAITELSELSYLGLGENKLRGNIPSSIGNLFQLRTLDLSYNPEINGSIPVSIGNLVNLDFLWLGANNSSQLSGSLPASLGNLPKIKRLIIAGTQISGAIPAELGNLTKVEYLRLNNNQLSGSIPASLGNLITLTDGLDLADNRLTGSIPASLGNLTNIKQIWLNNNQLSGAIPSSLTNLTQVTPGSFGIKVSNNRFNFDGLSASVLPLLNSARLEFLPQPPLVINKTGCTLSVTAGGNLANNTYTWLMHNRLDVVITGDSTRPDHQAGMYRVQVQNSEVPGITLSSNWIDVSGIVPDEAQELMATTEQTDADGWTHYDHIFTNDEGIPVDYVRLLSLKKNGNDIGTIGDGTFQVKLAATSGAGSGEGLLLTNPLITNTSGTYVMHRYWSVLPTRQPSSPVGVRFYFNDADINDIKGSVPRVVNASDLFFYKSVGGDPNPETNLSGATAIIGIYEGAVPGTESYVYDDLGCGIHRVEYMVRSFSGGGGGGTVNGLALPVKLTDFSGVYDNAQTLLKWITAQEIQASHFVVERSYDGSVFSPIGQVKAAGNSSTEQRYSFTDAEVQTANRIVYYRLLMADFDGKSEYSKVISISLPNTATPVKIGPNPAGNRLTIYLPATGYNRATRIGIYTMQGKQIVQQQIPPSSARTRDIDITRLTNGMYILVIESAEGVKSRHRFIKQR